MSNLTKLTKGELIEEIERLRSQYEECSDAENGNGKFDEDELFALAGEAEGDELFLVTDTGRFVYVNDTMQQQLGYSREELLGMSLPRIDRENTRAQWLHRVSRIKRSGAPEVFESEQVANDGSTLRRDVTARYVTYRGRNYVLCVGSELKPEEEERRPPTAVRTRQEVLQQMTSDGVLIVDTRGTIIESNAVADRLLGVPKSEIISRSCVDSRWRFVDAAGEPLSISNHPIMVALVEEQQLFNRRIDMLSPDGSRRSLLVNAAPLHDSAGDLIGAVGCIRPFDDSAERGDELQRAKAMLSLQRSVSELILHAGSEDELERRVCQLLVDYGSFPLVWRAVTQEKDERLHPSVSAGEETDYLMKIKVRYDDTPHGNGPLGRAMKNREPVIIGDLLADPTHEPWMKQAEKSELHSLAALPLLHEGREYGLLSIYSKDRDYFGGPELKGLTLVADLLAFGVHIHREAESVRRIAGEHILQQRMLEAYEESASVAIALFDADDPFRCLYANQHFASLLDEPFHSAGVEEQFISDFMYSLYHRDLYQQMQQAAAGDEPLSEDGAVFTDWRGEDMHWNWRIFPVTSADGETQLLYAAYRVPVHGAETGGGDESAVQPEEESSTRVAGAAVTAGGVVKDPGLPTETEEAAEQASAEATGEEPAVVIIDYPRFGPRSKTETRIHRFLEEGILTEVSTAASALFSTDRVLPGESASALFGERHASFLGELLGTKETSAELGWTDEETGRRRICHAFFSGTDDGQRVCLVFSS